MMVCKERKCVEYTVCVWGGGGVEVEFLNKLCRTARRLSAVTLRLVPERRPLLNSNNIPAILAEILRCFTDLLQVSATLLPGIGSDVFFQNPFLFIASQSSYYRSSTNWYIDSIVK
jgi:hypothetical protein